MAGDRDAVQIDRDELFADRSLVGTVFCRAYARRVDEWLESLFEATVGKRPGVSLVALGGYGRSELCPQSDLDVMLLHEAMSESQLSATAEALWYPVYDAHIALGHSVRTISQSLELARTDLETATSLLSLRHIAGDAELSDDLTDQATRQWRKNRRKWLPEILHGAHERETREGELAFLLEPDIKTSSGGLRDVHAVGWIEAAGISILDQERRDLRAANNTLLAARVELHRATMRKGDRLFLDEQDGVADALGIGDADVMMSEIAAAARTVNWIAGNVFHRAERKTRRLRFRADRPKSIANDIVSIDGTIGITATAQVGNDPALVLRLAVAAAEKQAWIDRDSLDKLVEFGPEIPMPWQPEVRELFVRLLLTGDDAIPVIETLDHVGLFTRLLPEWEPNRSKVQRNQYHRFTVDRHLLEAASIASDYVDRVERPDLLVIGALLHDIGKGYPGDHTDVGVVLIDTIATNMGFDADDVDTLKRLCEHHLLLPDAATRRDIQDPDTIAAVAEQVRTPEFLHLLAALTEADSIATGPSAWSKWKAQLMGELAYLTEEWLRTGGEAPIESTFPNADQQALFEAHDHLVTGAGDTLTVITKDRPGVFARVAGAVSLKLLTIRGAQTHVEAGKVLEVLTIAHPDDVEGGDDHPIDWARLLPSVEEILATTDDLRPRFRERANSQLRRTVVAPNPIEEIRVDFHNDATEASTIIEVAGPDRIGLLYELSRALVDAGLDQQQTRIQTVGDDVVDSFYVQTLDGEKLTDADAQAGVRETLLEILRS